MSASTKYLYSLLRGWEVFKHLRQLERTQWLPYREIQRLQLKKLKALLRHAYENVPIYREIFKQAGTKPEDIHRLTDIHKLPITTKDELKMHSPNQTIAGNYDISTLVKGETGGTTGIPFKYYKDARTIHHELAALHRFRSWYGFFDPKQTFLRLFPYYAPWSKEFKSFLMGWLICDRSQLTLSKYSQWTRRFSPRSLEGSPVAFYALAKFSERTGQTRLSLPVVLSTSETLHDTHKQKIESVFNCRVFNHYGCNEICTIAQECEEHTGLHINAEDRIVEFVRSGELVSPGEAGEIVITDLENYAMPFIRYNIKDVGRPMSDLCSCGRGLPLIKEIDGRSSDLLVTPKGDLLTSDILAQFIIFRDQRWTQQFQIIQCSGKELLIKIVKDSEFAAENLELILGKIREQLGSVKVKTDFVESISIPSSGKHRFVLSKESPESLG
jgi:phenylacetate-CoA ligase